MRVYHWPYELKPRTSLSSRANGEARVGALIKVEADSGACGYADLHPWPELGDLPLQTQLSFLKDGKTTPLSQNSLRFAEADAQARLRNESLWSGLEPPASHILVPEIGELFDERMLGDLLAQGFDRIKIKLGRDPENEAVLLKALCGRLKKRALLRLDFNSSLSPEAWTLFAASLDELTRESIEFIEDPIAWDADRGFGAPLQGLSLALDREVEKLRSEELAPPFLIVKPAVTDPAPLIQKAMSWQRRLVFTSYLDHPLGQLWAAWSAAKTAQILPVETCGLLSQDAYEPHALSPLIQARGPKLIPPAQTAGICDEALLNEICDWKELRA